MNDTSKPREEQPADPAAETTPPRRQRYSPPKLTDYGSVAKITQAGGVSAADGPVGFMMN